MRILLIHPEGNVNYNPNLLGLLEVMGEAGHLITYVARKRTEIDQPSSSPFVTVVLLDPSSFRDQLIDYGRWGGHDFALGIDRGVIEGSCIARHYRIPHALLSYEIFFPEETRSEFKAPEIDACRDVAFAIAPDGVRARKLSSANDIPMRKILEIPVAGRGFRRAAPKPRLWHQRFQLPERVKIVLYAGSIADWTGAEYLLKSTVEWPEDWVLIIHERYGPTAAIGDLIRRHARPDRVRHSDAKSIAPGELSRVIQSADLGVALYRPTYSTAWVGRNIEYIGLASGKISTYLQHGVPVATHDLGQIADWIRFYGAGQIFSLERPFVPEQPRSTTSDACRQLFETHLDLNRFVGALLQALSDR